MTNPSNAVGTNAAYGGRTSVNAFNDNLAAYSRGVISGWACAPSSGLTVVVGGNGTTRDVAVAEDNAGNKTTINNISGSPISVTMSAAPGANSRIDVIVAYVDNPPQGSNTIADNYEACGLISVQGTAAADPVVPNDSAIRSAITADGASGTTAYYVILATITIASGTTDITADDIADGESAKSVITPHQLDLLFTGAANTPNENYSLDYDLTNYRVLFVKGGPQAVERMIVPVPVQGITYGNTDGVSYELSIYEGSGTYCAIKFSFIDSTTFRIRGINLGVWSSGRISEIWGLK